MHSNGSEKVIGSTEDPIGVDHEAGGGQGWSTNEVNTDGISKIGCREVTVILLKFRIQWMILF